DPFAEEEEEKEEEEERDRSDRALQDLGFGEKEKDAFADDPPPPSRDSFDDKKEDSFADDSFSAPSEEKKPAPAGVSGLKPVGIIRGGFNYGIYQQLDGTEVSTLGKAFGSLDDAIIGAEYKGKAVFAKGTLNMRTHNSFLSKDLSYNPLMKENFDNGGSYLYEAFGGMKLFNILILRAGQMIPTYGIMDEYQELGLVVGTPFGTRALAAVEAIVPETDAGFAVGVDYSLTEDSGVKAEFMTASGKIGNAFSNWDWDKTYAMYIRAGYYSEIITGYASLQYRNDYKKDTDTGDAGKTFPNLTFGVHAKFDWKGIMANFSFDYNQFQTIDSNLEKKSKGNMLIHVMPGYEFRFRDFGMNVDALEAVQLGIRFDFVQGIYNNPAAQYFKAEHFDKSSKNIRFGTALNVFASEVAGIRSFFGFTFMMQPDTELVDDSKKYGFKTILIQGGAEF
ncbi:MAG: hypothetical protein R6W70_01465, partial [bacterium]